MGRKLVTALAAALLFFASSAAALAADADGDGLDDSLEVAIGTNPNLADTDGDGSTDKVEFFDMGTSPNAADTDGDTMIDSVDPAPLDATGLLDGFTTPTWAGFPTTEQYARSGLSAFAGRSVLIHSGAVVRRYSFAQSRGIRPSILWC